MEEYTFDDAEVEESEPTTPTETHARPQVGTANLASSDSARLDELEERVSALEALVGI